MTAKHELHAAESLQGAHRRPTRLSAELLIRRGRAEKPSRPINAPLFLIGSDADCDLVLGDPQFPGSYAYIFHRGSQLTFRWLGEGPELTVNGEAFSDGKLVNGDRIRCGPYEFQLAVTSGGGAKDKKRSLQQIIGHAQATEETAREAVENLISQVKRNLFGDHDVEEAIPSNWRRATA
ncbi:FHA domain-containing protein [Blastopirellula sp. JC732]|uniref:FHA domain-containing protein n=1 Tax=Blastopirellula sediminis TaxID=2894196 RepID=A0A9X1SJ21_9BACT|nr:FHA domain-containing protein [Blastopirellula sediminis]MCC9605279.1 FHA domain-containing protein [Blastopirellula sediminis]MCC9631421.1 FHA domain-containing protein [Blastopirellula sediminis]